MISSGYSYLPLLHYRPYSLCATEICNRFCCALEQKPSLNEPSTPRGTHTPALRDLQCHPAGLSETQDREEGDRARGHDQEGRTEIISGAMHQPSRGERTGAANHA